MRRIPRRLLVLHADPVLRERLRKAATAGRFEITECGSWEELQDRAPREPSSCVIVVDPYAEMGRGRGPSPDLSAFLHRFPSLAVTAAMAVVPGRLDDVRRLGMWGVVQVIDLEEELATAAIVHRLDSAAGRPLRSLLLRTLPSDTSGPAKSILSAAASVATDGGGGEDLARMLYVTPRTVTRWCRKAGLPPPRRLLAWMRILLATELLDDPGRTVSDVALSCGYAADSSLRLALKNFLQRTPTALREEGAFRVASGLFLRALVEARSEAKRYRAERAPRRTPR